MRVMRLLMLSSAVAGVIGCGGSEDDGTNPSSELSNCWQPGYDIYLGYYNEDPSDNPEDPTSGFLIACIPDSSGSFKSQFLFSYAGCAGGVDTGTVNGSRTGNSISGQWSGVVDGRNIGGNFSGNWNSFKFSGTWSNSKGKLLISESQCSYYVASKGTWVLYSLDSDEGGLNITISGSSPTISWNSVANVQGYSVSIYDKKCMYDRISISKCTMWSVTCPSFVTSLNYGSVPVGCSVLAPVQNLTQNKDYVVSLIAYGSDQSDVKAFATRTFTTP